MKKIIVCMALVTLCFIFGACGDDGSFLEGKWERVGDYEKGQEVAAKRNITFVFDDEMVSMTKGDETQNYYYKYEDNIIYCLETKDDNIENAVGSFTVKENSSDKLIIMFNNEDGRASDYGYVLKKLGD